MSPSATPDWSVWQSIRVQAQALFCNAGWLPRGCLFLPERSPALCDNPHPKGGARVHSGKLGWHCPVHLFPATHDRDCNERGSDRGVTSLPFGNERSLRQSGPFGKQHCPKKPEHPDPLVACPLPFHSGVSPRPPGPFPEAPYRDCTRHPTSRAAFARPIGNERCRRRSCLFGGEQYRDSCAPSSTRDFLLGWCAKVFQYRCRSRLAATSTPPNLQRVTTRRLP